MTEHENKPPHDELAFSIGKWLRFSSTFRALVLLTFLLVLACAMGAFYIIWHGAMIGGPPVPDKNTIIK
ncbi:MAG: hypothetical protein WBC90_17975 [Albidovulum sp.]